VPFDVVVFSQSVAASHGRPIVLRPVSELGPGTVGVWIPTPEVDIIAYARHTTRMHQEHIVLHELSHIICGHRPVAADSDIAKLLFPDLSADLVRVFLERRSYSSDQELEAEVLASLIREKAAQHDRSGGHPSGVDLALLGRLEAFRQGDTPA
jgi:hypothetical protein